MATATIIPSDCRTVADSDRFEADLAFADPPFNIGHGYVGYHDKLARDEFVAAVEQWTLTAARVVRDGGLVALHGPDDLAEIYLRVAAAAGWRRLAWVNWHYRFGQCRRSSWIDARAHCLIYDPRPTAEGRRTWNPDAVLVESDRVRYGDRRIGDSPRGGSRVPGTIWGIPSDGPGWGRVTGNSRERRQGHPNQLPEKYIERLLLAYTNPGDTVFDLFGGSGTVAAVATRLGRDSITTEISLESCQSIVKRVEEEQRRCQPDQ